MNKIIITFIFLVCVVFNLPILWYSYLNNVIVIDDYIEIGVKSIKKCELSDDNVLFSIILTFIDTVFYCLIPFMITIIFSLSTLYNLKKSANSKKRSDSASTRLRTNSFTSEINLKKINHSVKIKKSISSITSYSLPTRTYSKWRITSKYYTFPS